MNDPTYIVFAHGSSVESANEAVREVARRAAALGRWRSSLAAFLEGGSPALGIAVGDLISRGESRFVIVPYFLTLGLHLQRDLPKLIAGIKAQHPNIEIEVTEPLDGHPAMEAALVDRANTCARS
jgi:sirohydrochlorin ferrochelatase